MSLSRPARFPLLKLPWLCIKCVLQVSDLFDLIFFAVISQKTRRFVRSFNIHLSGIEVYLERWTDKHISLGNSNKKWVFKKESEARSSSEEHLVLQKNVIPFYTKQTNDDITSYTDGNVIDALKLAIQFLNEMFKCSVERVNIDADNFTESGDIGVRSTMQLMIRNQESQSFGYALNQKLNYLLEKLEVTGTCIFWVKNTGSGFYVDPKLFKCKKLMFFLGTAAWVTLEILMQFDVPRLTFFECPFSVEDILSFVTNWFHSDNKELERLYIPYQCEKFSLETFQATDLNPVPFSGRNRVPLSESFRDVDFSEGLEIVRHDGLQATIHVEGENFMFYIWNNQ